MSHSLFSSAIGGSFQPAARRVSPGRGLVAPVLARQQAAGERAPHQHAELLVDRDRDQLVFGLARLQRVVDLLRHERDAAFAARDLERLHHVPAGEVGAADVAHLARAHERVERLERLLERRQPVPLVDLIEVDDVGAQPLEARFAGADEVPARQALVVRARAHGEARLGGDQHAGRALAAHRLAENFFGEPGRIDVGGVDQIDAGVGDEVDQPARFGERDRADLGEAALAAERHRSQGQLRDLQSRIAQLSVFHRHSPLAQRDRAAGAIASRRFAFARRLAGIDTRTDPARGRRLSAARLS